LATEAQECKQPATKPAQQYYRSVTTLTQQWVVFVMDNSPNYNDNFGITQKFIKLITLNFGRNNKH